MKWIKIFVDKKSALEKLTENKPQLVIIGDKRICLVLRDHEFYAVSDRCTHNGESLSKGKVNFAGEIVCPWHGYQFNLRSGREWQERSQDLVTFPIREEADGLYIGI
jgi:3-phenylpropionate/trans-cinnamate dioxygenase ferredoxin subunit